MPNRTENTLPELSSRAKRGICFLIFLSAFAAPLLNGQVQRPPILGISRVRLASTNLDASVSFFKTALGYHGVEYCKNRTLVCFWVDAHQVIQLDAKATQVPSNLVEEIGFLTPDVSVMRKFLKSQGLNPSHIETDKSATASFSITDPEGHRISFAQHERGAYYMDYDPRVSKHLIHAGFIVQDREKMEHFYKDILGFRPYWHGGMKDDETSWVSLQVPDGTDWLEFMLYDPAGKDKRFLGIMNHVALGVTDIHAAQEQLRKNGAPLTEEPKIGRDGKWQLNLYDLDLTRVEFMEFEPKEKPCCSDFTGPHPKP